MIAVTPGLTLIILIAGIVAGAFGATLGLGGGIFLVPFLNLVLGLPITVAAAISLTTVIATSSSVSVARAGQRLNRGRWLTVTTEPLRQIGLRIGVAQTDRGQCRA